MKNYKASNHKPGGDDQDDENSESSSNESLDSEQAMEQD